MFLGLFFVVVVDGFFLNKIEFSIFQIDQLSEIIFGGFLSISVICEYSNHGLLM